MDYSYVNKIQEKQRTLFQRKSKINALANRKLHQLLSDVKLVKKDEQSTVSSKKHSEKKHSSIDYYFSSYKTASQKKILSTDLSSTKLTQSALSINFNQSQSLEDRFVIYGDATNLQTIKVTTISNHFQPSNIQELYQNNQKIFTEICHSFQQPIKFFFLPNMQPIGFFEEIPSSVKVIIVSRNFTCNFWSKLFAIHLLKNIHWQPIYTFLSKCTSEAQAVKVLRSKHLLLMAQRQEGLQELDFMPDQSLINQILYRDQGEHQEAWYKRPSRVVRKQREEESDPVREEDSKKDFIMMQQNISGDQLKSLLKPQQVLKNDYYLGVRKDVSRKFIEKNKEKYSCLLRKINKKMPLLSSQNIPQQLSELSIDRKELYNKYTKYKTLLFLQQDPNFESGLAFQTFYYGLDDQRMAPLDLIKNLFMNYCDITKMKWNEYIKVVDLLQATSTHSKVQLITKLIDKNNDGVLSYAEILERCDIMLKRIIPTENKDNKLFSLSDFMTRTIFESVGNPLHQDIAISQIQNMIESNNPQVNLLLMICCGDMHNSD